MSTLGCLYNLWESVMIYVVNELTATLFKYENKLFTGNIQIL